MKRVVLVLTMAALMVAVMVVAAGPAFAKNEKVTACHNRDNNPHEISVSVNAWAAHERHGDTIGACPP